MNYKDKESTRSMWLFKSLRVVTLSAFILAWSSVSAQESINTAGGNASESGGSVSYSVGQVVYQTYTGTNGSITQGVQQPYEISVITAVEEAKNINLSVLAYPNPATDFLQLKVDGSMYSVMSMSFQLYDMNGKLLQTKKLTEAETQIDMSSFVPATYFLKVITESKAIKEFKIIKTQ